MDRYSEYKDSGIEWIGEIPRHWEVLPTKYVSTIVCGSTPNSGEAKFWDGTINWYTPSDLGKGRPLKTLNTSSRKITYTGLNSIGGSLVNSNSLILSTRAPVGKVAISLTRFTTNQGCKSLIAKEKSDVNYLYYFYSVCTEALKSASNGTTFTELTTFDLSGFIVSLPPKNEQELISKFLDKKTSHIDSLIEKIERKIKLLREYRSALISHCVTKGLNPDVEMKDSGIEWIGVIPRHWVICPLKIATTHINEIRTPMENEVKLSPENVESGTGRVLNYFANYDGKGMHFQISDTLLNKLRIYLSKVVFCETSGLSMGEMIVLRPVKFKPKFQFYLLLSESIINYLNSFSEGTKVPRPPIRTIMGTKVPIPPNEEQFEIIQYLNKKTTQIDSLIDQLKRKIELQKEYRQSMISNVVTGKLRVPGIE